jgi:hypothetical protein
MMSRLPSMQYVIQQIDGDVVLYEDGTEAEICRFDPAEPGSVAQGRVVINVSGLGDEDRCFAHFWSGYFAAYAGHPAPAGGLVTYDEPSVLVNAANGNSRIAVVIFNPDDANAAAQAQGTIHFSALLSDEEKSDAHFWSGYFYGHAAR